MYKQTEFSLFKFKQLLKLQLKFNKTNKNHKILKRIQKY